MSVQICGGKVCQKYAARVVLKAAPAAGSGRGKFLTSASSCAFCAESKAGGGGGRNSLPEEITQVRQVPASGVTGLVPRQKPGPVGIGPVKTASEPSVFARAITNSATLLPSSIPAETSLGNCTPALSRDSPHSCA